MSIELSYLETGTEINKHHFKRYSCECFVQQVTQLLMIIVGKTMPIFSLTTVAFIINGCVNSMSFVHDMGCDGSFFWSTTSIGLQTAL